MFYCEKKSPQDLDTYFLRDNFYFFEPFICIYITGTGTGTGTGTRTILYYAYANTTST